MNTERIFSLYVLDAHLAHPRSSTIGDVLGERGEAPLLLLERHLEATPRDRDLLFYEPILLALIEHGFDFCRSPHNSRLQAILAGTPSRNHDGVTEAENLRRFCLTDLSRVPG
jgi:hypothetical protein